MNNLEQGNQAHGGPHDDNPQPGHGPYWKRAHHDWRFWMAAIFIFTAMTIYVLTVELSLPPDRQPPAQLSGAVVK